jgi:hypothetical protein
MSNAVAVVHASCAGVAFNAAVAMRRGQFKKVESKDETLKFLHRCLLLVLSASYLFAVRRPIPVYSIALTCVPSAVCAYWF